MSHFELAKNYHVSLPSKFDQWQKIHPVLVLVQFDKSTNWRQGQWTAKPTFGLFFI